MASSAPCTSSASRIAGAASASASSVAPSEGQCWLGMTNRAVQLGAIFIVINVFLAVAIYMPLEGLSFIDCIYFGAVIGTTVGYGDFLPSTNLSKLLTIVYIHMAMISLAILLQGLVTLVLNKALRQLVEEDQGMLLDAERFQRRRRLRLFTFIALYVAIVFAGTLFFSIGPTHFGDDAKGSRWVNALYFTVVTVSTVGFGDLSPQDSGAGKGFALMLMLVGIPVFATTLGLISAAMFGESKDSERVRHLRNLTKTKFDKIQDFCRELKELEITDDTDDAGTISRFEFLCFGLVNSGACELDDLQGMMKNFNQLDRDRNGSLDPADVEAWMSSLRKGSSLLSAQSGHSLGLASEPAPQAQEHRKDVATLPTILSVPTTATTAGSKSPCVYEGDISV